MSPSRAKQNAALVTFIAILLAIASWMTWLVVTGLDGGQTWFPSKRASQQRTVVKADEPVMFYVSIGLYGVIGVGSAGLAAWMVWHAVKKPRTDSHR